MNRTQGTHRRLYVSAICFTSVFIGLSHRVNAQQLLDSAFPDRVHSATAGLAKVSADKTARVNSIDDSVPTAASPSPQSSFGIPDSGVLDIQISPTRKLSLIDGTSCELLLTNRSAQNAALVKYLTVLQNGTDILKAENYDYFVAGSLQKDLEAGGIWLAAGQTRSYAFTVKSTETSKLKKLAKTIFTPSALAPKDDFEVQAKIDVFTADQKTLLGQTELRRKVSAVIDSPSVAVFVGCIVGVLLVTAFARSRGLLVGFDQILSSALKGSCASIIAVIFLKYTRELRLPITVEVADFYGGLMIGLLSRKLGDLIEPLVEPKPQPSISSLERIHPKTPRRVAPALAPARVAKRKRSS